MTKFEEIWKKAAEEADLKYRTKGTLSWRVFLKEGLKSRIEPIIQQQSLPEVPEDVAKLPPFDDMKEYVLDERLLTIREYLNKLDDKSNSDIKEAEAWCMIHEDIVYSAMLNGYKVEKPQLFRVCLLDGRHTLTRRDPRKTLPFNYTFLWSYSSELKEMREINRKVDLFTEQEIKSIDERYWQFAVPVEDGE